MSEKRKMVAVRQVDLCNFHGVVISTVIEGELLEGEIRLDHYFYFYRVFRGKNYLCRLYAQDDRLLRPHDDEHNGDALQMH